MNKKISFLYFVLVIMLVGGVLWTLHNLIGDWEILGMLFGWTFLLVIFTLVLIAGLITLIRWTSLRHLNKYVKKLYEAGYDAPGINDFEVRWFTICLFYAAIMVPASVWLWYEMYLSGSTVIWVFVPFTTIIGTYGTWQAVKTWMSVSKRLKGHYEALKNGRPVTLPRLRN